MSQRTIQPVSNRPARRHERRDGHDIADIYEARLLAQGMRSDDFITLRSATDVPPVPDIRPVRFGRGVEPAILLPIAEATNEPKPADATDASTTSESAPPESE
jgi:hypothetical protein